MTVLEIATELISLCQTGQNFAAMEKLYSDDIARVPIGSLPMKCIPVPSPGHMSTGTSSWSGSPSMSPSKPMVIA
jgi:hypothetical protein